MTFTTIKDDIKAFGKKKHGYMTGYIAKQEELHKQLQNGMIGEKYAKDQLEAYKLEGDTYSRDTYNKIHAEIEKQHELELEALKEKELSVTADDVAELTLLASMKMTKDELLGYFEKYKNKPLAIKKLWSIAEQYPEIAINLDLFNAEQALESLILFFKQQLSYCHYSLLINGDKIQAVTTEMVVNSDAPELDRRLDEYLNK